MGLKRRRPDDNGADIWMKSAQWLPALRKRNVEDDSDWSHQPERVISQNVQVIVSEEKTIRGVVGAIPPHMTRGGKGPKQPTLMTYWLISVPTVVTMLGKWE